MKAILIYGEGEAVNLLDVYQKNERWAVVASHVLVCLMMICLTASLTQFLGQFLPLSDKLPLWGGLIAGEAFLSYRTTRKKSPFSSEWLLARGAEWVVILAVTKVIVELQYGWEKLLQDLSQWQHNFGASFFNGEYASVLFVLVIIWVFSTLYTADLAEMEGNEFIQGIARMDQAQIEQVRASAALYGLRVEDDTVPSNRRDIHNRLLSRTLTLGIVMVIIAGILRQDQITLWQGQPIARISVTNVVLFFVFGLTLFSQTNFLALRAAWGYEHIRIHPHLASRWVLYSLVFVLGLGVLALVLPTHYSLGLLDTWMVALSFLRAILEFVIGLILLPVVLVFRLFSMLFGGGGGKAGPAESQPVAPVETPPPVTPAHANLPWWEILRSFLFWGAFIAILAFALYQYIRQNQALWAALQSLSVVKNLKKAWQWLRDQFRLARRGVAGAVRTGFQKLQALRYKPISAQGWRFLNPNRLAPRQRVIFYYLALLRRGQEAGLPRHPSQTPSEYAQLIEPSLADRADAVVDITEGFLEARYSRHEVTSERVTHVKQAWKRIREGLKSRRRRP